MLSLVCYFKHFAGHCVRIVYFNYVILQGKLPGFVLVGTTMQPYIIPFWQLFSGKITLLRFVLIIIMIIIHNDIQRAAGLHIFRKIFCIIELIKFIIGLVETCNYKLHQSV